MSKHSSICSHMCVRRLRRARLKHAGICDQSSPLAPWHKNSHSVRPTALPSTAALLTRAPRFNYWPVSALKLHQLSRTGNCLSPCKGGNWRPGLWRKVHIHCSSVHLITLWIVGRLHHGELEAYASSTGRRFNRQVSEAGWSRSACIHWGNKQDILAGLTGNKWTQETLNHSYFLVRLSHFIPPTVSSRRLVVRQAEVVQLHSFTPKIIILWQLEYL